MMAYAPATLDKWRTNFKSYVLPEARADYEHPYPNDVAATLVGTMLLDIGHKNRFAPVVCIFGHGSTSTNNPFWSAYQCGACQGNDGAPNARLFARLANDPAIREILAKEHDIDIPSDTHFVG